MVKAISEDLRLRVVGAIESGLTRRQAAEKYNVSVASAVRWHQRFRETGSVATDVIGGNRRPDRLSGYARIVKSWVDVQPDITLREIQERLEGEFGERFASSVIWRFLDRHNYTFKKRQATQQNKNGQT